MEELLNKLIEKGWKPFNVDCAWTNVEVINKIKDNWYIPEHSKIIFKTETHWHVFDCNIRDLVSKWSWLWQFVCENDLLNIKKEKKRITPEHLRVFNWEYQYRLIESALCDEDKLEEFLLDNIKIWNYEN